ncbi:hypothetical protein [Saccharopolyspora sp. NPDC002376]
MSEELLRESLRSAVVDEPPMGIDPADVVAEGRRRQRRRRAVVDELDETPMDLAELIALATDPQFALIP